MSNNDEDALGLLQAIEGAAGKRLKDFRRDELERLVKGLAQTTCCFISLLHQSLHQSEQFLILFADALYELKKPRGRPKKRGPLTALLHFFPDALPPKPPKQPGRPKKYTAEQYGKLVSVVDLAKELRDEEGCYDLSDKATIETLLTH
jgi:hypothetical protein